MAKKYIPISELGSIITGKTPSTADNGLWGGSIPFITPTDINGYTTFYQDKTERFVSTIGANKQKTTILPPNSICITSIGSTIGKACLTKVTSITNQQINSIIPNKAFDYRYILYLMRYNLPYLQLVGGGSGSGTPIISKNKFAKFKFLVEESLPTQRRIASILSTYDSLIENNTRRIRLLEQMAENLYKEWFVRFRFPGHENCKMVEGIPEGWKYEKFGKLCPIVTGKKDANFASPNGPYKFFTCSKDDLLADSYSFDCFAIILAGNGDLNVKLYKGKFEAYQRTYVLSPYSLDNIFIGFYTIQAELDRLLVGAAGAVIKFLTKGMIENIKVIIPTDDVLSSFNSFMMNNYEERQKLISSSASLARQRDMLLPRLMSGKIDV